MSKKHTQKMIREIKTALKKIEDKKEQFDFGDDEWMELHREEQNLQEKLRKLREEGA